MKITVVGRVGTSPASALLVRAQKGAASDVCWFRTIWKGIGGPPAGSISSPIAATAPWDKKCVKRLDQHHIGQSKARTVEGSAPRPCTLTQIRFKTVKVVEVEPERDARHGDARASSARKG